MAVLPEMEAIEAHIRFSARMQERFEEFAFSITRWMNVNDRANWEAHARAFE